MSELVDNQFLTFVLDGETYAVPVGKVREVLEYTKPTKLPRTVDFLKGIINVRGTGIPVIDLRAKFGMPEMQVSGDTAILIMEISDSEGSLHVIGALTDEVNEVIEIDDAHMEPAPRFGAKVGTDFIHSVGKRDDSFIIVLDIDKVFDAAETNTIAGMASSATA